MTERHVCYALVGTVFTMAYDGSALDTIAKVKQAIIKEWWGADGLGHLASIWKLEVLDNL